MGRRLWSKGPNRPPPAAAAAGAVLFQIILLVLLVSAQKSNGASGTIHAEGYCSMYGICAQRSDGKPLNCPNATLSVVPNDLFSSRIQSLCPAITGNVCCTVDQFDKLRGSVQQAIPFLVGCPACLRNFLNLFCELTCSPNQSLFINVTSIKQVNNAMTVDGIDYYVTNVYGEGLYDSCKDVKFGSLNTRAMDFIGAGAQNYTEWFSFLGHQSNINEPGSPFAIRFRSDISASSGMKPVNETVYSCGDPSLGCSCGDCPSSTVCGNSAPPNSQAKRSCSFIVGSLRVTCLEFSMTIVYLVLLSAFLLWSLLHRKQEQTLLSSRTNPLQNARDKDQLHSISKAELSSGNEQFQMAEGVPPGVKAPQVSVVQIYMTKFFRKHGIFVTRYPTLALGLSLAIPVILSIGLIRFKVETRPEKLWVSPGSKAAEEKLYFDSHLAPFYRIEQLIIATVQFSRDSNSPTIVTDRNMKLLFQVQRKIDGLRASYSGHNVSLTNVCMKPLGSDCGTQSILQYFQMDFQKYDDYGGVDHAMYCFQHYSSEQTCLSTFQAPTDPSTVLGGFSGSNYSEASAFVITYPVNNQVEITGQENGMAVAWEKAFINLVKEEILPLVQLENLTLSFSSESSIQEELKRESTADKFTIMISYIVMFTYISFTLGSASFSSSIFVSSKVLLALSGVVLVLLSVLGSVGFFSAVGVKSTLIIMEVIPFLVLAVGVDNMCILVHAVKRQRLGLALEERISNALVEVGPSITLASLSEVVAFAVGTFTTIPAVRVFSMFAALAVLLDFLLQVTAFVALIVFDFLRAEDGRVDCVPCIQLKSRLETDEGSDKHELGLLARYMRDVHAPILGHRGVKIIVVSVFVGFAFASIVLCTKLQPGLEQQVVLPRDSYLQDYFGNLEKYLRVGPPLYFVVKDFNYSSDSDDTNRICSINQCNSNSLVNEITKASLTPESSYVAKPAASWLDDYLVWLSPEAFGCCRKFLNGSYCPPDDQPPCCQSNQSSCGIDGVCKDCTTCFRQSDLHDGRPSTKQFQEKLPWFLNAVPSSDCAKGGKGAYTTNLNISGFESGIIQASAFRTYHTPLNNQSDFVKSMKAARDFSSKMSNSLQMQIFPYSVFYIFYEQYMNIWRTALINLAIGLGAVFVCCLIVTSSLWASAIILLVLAMIILDMMGVMAIVGILLNGISIVNLVMSIGIAVEFCVHITHAFMRNHTDKTSGSCCPALLKVTGFCGLLLSNVHGSGAYLFLAWSRVPAGIDELMWASSEGAQTCRRKLIHKPQHSKKMGFFSFFWN